MTERASEATVSGNPVQYALRLAAEWRLIGLLFERPRPEWRDELRQLAGEVDCQELGVVAAAVLRSDEGAYLRVLGHGGAVSPRAVSYRLMEDPGRILADLAGCYEAFRFEPRGEDPADHVAIEVGFAGYLWLKQAYARSMGDDEKAITVDEALRGFLTDHLAPLAASLARRLDELQVVHPLASAARVLAGRTAEYSRKGSEAQVVRMPFSEDGAEFGCPGCG